MRLLMRAKGEEQYFTHDLRTFQTDEEASPNIEHRAHTFGEDVVISRHICKSGPLSFI